MNVLRMDYSLWYPQRLSRMNQVAFQPVCPTQRCNCCSVLLSDHPETVTLPSCAAETSFVDTVPSKLVVMYVIVVAVVLYESSVSFPMFDAISHPVDKPTKIVAHANAIALPSLFMFRLFRSGCCYSQPIMRR
jgi:hypothetical protein